MLWKVIVSVVNEVKYCYHDVNSTISLILLWPPSRLMICNLRIILPSSPPILAIHGIFESLLSDRSILKILCYRRFSFSDSCLFCWFFSKFLHGVSWRSQHPWYIFVLCWYMYLVFFKVLTFYHTYKSMGNCKSFWYFYKMKTLTY